MSSIVFVLSKCDFQLTIVTAKPFSPENPCRSPNIQGIYCHAFDPESDQIQFTKESPKYFNGCNIIAATAPYPPFTFAEQKQESKDNISLKYVGGLEIELVHSLSKKLGFTVEFDQSHDYEVVGCINKYSIKAEVGIEPDRQRRKIDFCFGGMAAFYDSVSRYDISFTYMFSELSWFVADAGVAPQWEIIFKVFSSDVLLWLVLVSLIVALIYDTLDRWYEYNACKLTYECKFKSIQNYIELLRTFLGLSSQLKPQASHSRVLFFAWSLFGLHVNIAFSTALFVLLRNPPVDKEITTIQDLKNSGLKVAGPSLYFEMFHDSNLDSTTRAVLNKRIKCTNMDQCFEQLFRYRNISILERYEHVRYLVNLNKNKIHKINQNMITLGICILLNRGNPLATDMNKGIMQAFEAGLIKQWEKETKWKFCYKCNVENSEEEKNRTLGVNDLQTAFFMLIFGCVASLSVFIIEIFLYFYKQSIFNRSVKSV